MHLINETMSGSAMQASAHAAQAWKQATHSSMHLINSSSKVDGSAPKQRGPGWDSAICLTTRGKVRSFRPSTQATERAAAETDRSDGRAGRRHLSKHPADRGERSAAHAVEGPRQRIGPAGAYRQRSQLRPARTPPSTSQIAPVTQLVSAESRNVIVEATSRAVPTRPSGWKPLKPLSASSTCSAGMNPR
jgi:hypothetical protein